MTFFSLILTYYYLGDDMKKVYALVMIISMVGSLYIYKDIRKNKIINQEIIDSLGNMSEEPVSKIEINNITYDPLVYIYNTHQKETYAEDFLNFNPSVLDAAYTLRDYLEELNIQTYVESNDFYDFMTLNNWDFNNLYKVSRFYLEDTMKQYKNIKLYIDFHRDSIKHDLSTISIGNKDYAKILFVVGISNDNYKENLKVVKRLNEIISKRANISRGILQKSSANANGIYNQDLSSNAILIEVGGYQNKFSEVDNTLKIIAESISDYLNE